MERREKTLQDKVRQENSGDGAESKQVAVIVDKHRQSELLFKERAESHTVAEAWEIGQIPAHDAGRIVGRAGEGKRDSHRLLIKKVDYGFETVDHGLEAKVKIIGA